MKLAQWFAVVVLCCAPERPVSAEPATDANIVTALDISESIDPRAMAIEIDGMADAIRSPEVLQAIRGGRHRQIGFAIFAWRDAAYPEFVAWSLIATEADAVAVGARLRSAFHAFVAADPPRPALDPHMTDLSGAIDHAAVLLLTAPFLADRSIVNVIGNGWDNVGEGPQRARDRLLAKGVTVNGVVLGYDPVLMDYYRITVIGGPGSFLLAADQPAAMAEVLTRKFLYDIASRGAASWPRVAAARRRR
jgi:hypothetical protein